MKLWKSHKMLRYAVVAAIFAAAATIAYFATAGRAEAQSADQELQTATARRGSLELIVSGTGNLVPASQVDVVSETSGELIELLVGVGDSVEAGQVLARFDDADARLALRQAEATLRERTSPLAIAEARAALAEAREHLRTAQRTYTVNQEGNRATAETLKAARAKLVVARAAMERAEDAYQRAGGSLSDDAGKAQAYLNYVNAQRAYATALASYNWYTGHPTDIEQAQLEADLALAEAKVLRAESLVAALTGAELPEGAFGESLIALELAQLDVEQARQTLASTAVRSPIAGTVTEIHASVGETLGGSPLLTLMDLSQPYVEFYLDETDVAHVAVDREVEVIFDAFRDAVYSGRVASLDPVLVSAAGVTAVHGVARLDAPRADDSPRLLVGLSAAIDVIGGRIDDAVLVPVEALREISAGTFGVFVVDASGGLTLRPVEVALQDETFAAITSGLEAGEIVSTGIVEVGS